MGRAAKMIKEDVDVIDSQIHHIGWKLFISQIILLLAVMFAFFLIIQGDRQDKIDACVRAATERRVLVALINLGEDNNPSTPPREMTKEERRRYNSIIRTLTEAPQGCGRIFEDEFRVPPPPVPTPNPSTTEGPPHDV